MTKIELKEKQFWVLVGNENLTLYSDKGEAIRELRSVLQKHPDATLAVITYTEAKEGKGTFNVEGLSWKEIALGWLPEK